jgi:hypothetical protein
MKRAGLQEKSSLEVEGSVEYNGAMKGRRRHLVESIYRGGSRLGCPQFLNRNAENRYPIAPGSETGSLS